MVLCSESNVVAGGLARVVTGPVEVRTEPLDGNPSKRLDGRAVFGRSFLVAVEPRPDMPLADQSVWLGKRLRQGRLATREADCFFDGGFVHAGQNTTVAVPVNYYRCLTERTLAVNVGTMTLGERVAAARKHKGLTQDRLAKLCGVTQQTIQKLEDGRARRSSALADICIETGVSLRWLARGEGQMLESQPARPDPVILSRAIRVLSFLAQMQAGAAAFLTDADAISAAYEEVSRTPSDEFDVEGASRRMAAWLRGRGDDGMERGAVVGAG